jgi:hypothetical protein
MRRTSVFLYYKTQAAGEANRRTVCEGELTLLRSRVVGNKNLFKVAQQLELGNFSQFLRSGSFYNPYLHSAAERKVRKPVFRIRIHNDFSRLDPILR